jgi:preprotein translocase subunit SecG
VYNLILIIHVIVCVLVVLIVLIQAGRSGGFSGLMGGSGGDALFTTSSQQSGLRKATVALAGIFMATSLFLTILSSRRTTQSVFQRQFPNLPPVSAPAQSNTSAGDLGGNPAPVQVPAEPVKK